MKDPTFAMSCSVFIQTPNGTASNKMLMQSILKMTNKILCHEHETLLKLNFIQLGHGAISLLGSVLISIYRIGKTLLTSKHGNVHATND